VPRRVRIRCRRCPTAIGPGNSAGSTGRSPCTPQRHGHDRLAGIAAGRRERLRPRLRPQRLEVDSDHAADRIDGADALATALSAARVGSSMCVTLGVIFASGNLRRAITQPQTSCRISGFSPIAEPMRRSGRPCGQENCTRTHRPGPGSAPTISTHASLRYSSMIDAISTRVGMFVFDLLEFLDPGGERAVTDEFKFSSR